MGVCISKCGDARQTAAVVAASISHSTSPAVDHDPNHSLKKFLHLYDNADAAKRSSSSPRPSLEDFLTIPHSSELFSLAGEDSERSRSPSPARTSRASIARSSISSRAASSPQPRTSTGGRASGRRSSADKPPIGPKGYCARKRPRGSFSGSDDLVAHRNLANTIARLEKFCDGKLMASRRSSSFRREADAAISENPATSQVESATTAHENPPGASRLVDDCHELARKLVGFANREPGDHNPSDDHTNPDTRAPADSHRAEIPASAAAEALGPKGIGIKNSSAMAADNVTSAVPFKGTPFEKSVTCFLKEVENLVSLIETPTSKAATRLPSLRFDEVDDKLQFTDFEATFEDCNAETLETTTVAENSHCGNRSSAKTSDAPEDPAGAAGLRTDGPEGATSENPASRISESPGKVRKGKNVINCPAARPALTELNANAAPMLDALAPKNPPTPGDVKGRRRGISRSLDLRECSIPPGEFNAFKRERRLPLIEEKHNLFTQAASSCGEKGIGLGAAKAPPNDGEAAPCPKAQVPETAAPCPPTIPAGFHVPEPRGLSDESRKLLATAFEGILALLRSPERELTLRRSGQLLELLAAEVAAE